MTTHTITSSKSGAIVHVKLDHIDGDDADAIRVAQNLIDDNAYDFDEPGDVYKPQSLSGLLVERHNDRTGIGQYANEQDEVSDGAHSALSMDIAGVTCLWTRGISKGGDCDDNLCICPSGTSIEMWIRGWDDGAREWAESFGFGRYKANETVDDDFDGEVSIQVEPYFASGTLGHTAPHMLCDEHGDTMVFDSYDDAQKHIESLEEGVYVLTHGELGRPNYRIIQAE